MSTSTTETEIDWSDPSLWEAPGQQEPLVGKRVRYMGREWHLAGGEFTVTAVDEYRRAVCKSDEYPDGTGVKIPVSMLDVID